MRETTLGWVRNTLPEIVHGQLPRAVGENVAVRIECDSAMLRVYAILIDSRTLGVGLTQEWKFELQDGTVDGRQCKCRLRDEDISLLCVSV